MSSIHDILVKTAAEGSERETPGGANDDDRNVQLTEDPANWQTEIAQHLVTQISLPAQAVPVVDLPRVDDETLDADGQVIMNVNGVDVVIPITIREGAMAPMDVFFFASAPEQIFPFTQDSVTKALAGSSADLQSVGIPQSWLQGYGLSESAPGDAMQSPHGASGYSKTAEQAIAGERLGVIEDAVSEGVAAGACLTKLADAVAADEDSLRAIRDLPALVDDYGEPTVGGMPKIASGMMAVAHAGHGCGCSGPCGPGCSSFGRARTPEPFRFDDERTNTADVYQIRAMGTGEMGRFRLHSTLGRVFMPQSIDLSPSEVREFLFSLFARSTYSENHDVGRHVNHLIGELMRDGEITITAGSKAKKPVHLLPGERAVDAKATGKYVVRPSGGGESEGGACFPDAYDFTGDRIPSVLFIGASTGRWAMQEAIAGVHDPSVAVTTMTLARMDRGGGRKVVFGWEGPGEHVFVSPPVMIERAELGGGAPSACIVGPAGQKLRLRFDSTVKHPMRAPGDEADSEGRPIFLFPADHVTARVAKRTDLISHPDTFSKLGNDRLEVEAWASGPDSYTVKVGSACLQGATRADARLFLSTAGAAPSYSNDLLKRASARRVQELATLEQPIMSMEEVDKLASEIEDLVADGYCAKTASDIQALATLDEIVKLAAMMPDGDLADRVMAIGLIEDMNAGDFMRYVPEFMRCMHRLGRLILYARDTGALQIQPLRRAMLLLYQVVELLRELGADQARREAAA